MSKKVPAYVRRQSCISLASDKVFLLSNMFHFSEVRSVMTVAAQDNAKVLVYS